jgi:hypothetical protein
MGSGLGSMALERLEEEIGELAAHIHAATCRWLLLVAEFDRREGSANWGAKSCGQAVVALRCRPTGGAPASAWRGAWWSCRLCATRWGGASRGLR